MAHCYSHLYNLPTTGLRFFTVYGPWGRPDMAMYIFARAIKDKKKININNLINKYNSKYKIHKIENGKSFELKSLHLRSYYHGNILAFGDLLHRIHPFAGQGFNMTIRDIKVISDLIRKKINLGLTLDSSVNSLFEMTLRHNNFIFSNSIDLVHEFFNLERKSKNVLISKSIQLLGRNPILNKMLTKIADRGITF